MSTVEMLIEPRTRQVGNGEVLRLLPWRRRRMVGPFIFADLFGPDDLAGGTGVDIDAHPHIGLSTVSYLFDGRMVHRDSTGAVQTIEPGAVNWMTAGVGIAHTERSHPDDREITRAHHGLQTWVALPTEDEGATPTFRHHGADQMPVEMIGAAQVTLLAGRSWGLESPVVTSSPLVFAAIELAADGAGWVDIDDEQPERAVLAIDDDLTLDSTIVPHQHLAVLEPGTRPRLAGRGRAILIGGEPLGKRFIWWNFVSSDQDRIEAAKADWSAGRFALVPDDNDRWVDMPTG